MPAGQDGFPLEEKLVKVAQVKGVQTRTFADSDVSSGEGNADSDVSSGEGNADSDVSSGERGADSDNSSGKEDADSG